MTDFLPGEAAGTVVEVSGSAGRPIAEAEVRRKFMEF